MSEIMIVCVGVWNNHNRKMQNLVSKCDIIGKYSIAVKQLGHIIIMNNETKEAYHFIFTSPSNDSLPTMKYYLYVESELTKDFLKRSEAQILGTCKITHDIILTSGKSELELLPAI